MTAPPTDLSDRLAELMHRDQRRLQRRLHGLRKARRPLDELTAEVEAAERRVARRRAAVPAVTYPEALPVSQRRDDIAAAIRDHQVVIVAGETGSGKTTQLPKICLELGRGVRGLIGHTQPRRIAARTVAERIAEELGTPLGGAVGYTVRFTDHVGEDTLVKLMTDGILLAEIQRDRSLSRYDTLIIDEAHERSLNIDFILGYLKELLPRRPDLKVIITSATIDPQRFSEHFGGAPIVEVSGRTYPVEVRYRPLIDSDDESEDVVRDQTQAICDAVGELFAEPPGDVLVFLSGEREIRDTADALGRLDLRNTEIVPLYARLSAAEQHRVFQPHTGRRVVLATNVAETSLTVPGIRYVVDPGTARISRYSHRTKVQRLPIERISQASANQRKGRCGRVAEGICIRLYSEEDFTSRPAFTDPEILRTNLASVILQMTALGLGDIAAFPFVEAPDRRNIRDGVDLLHELGAIRPSEPDPRKRLTDLGRKLAQLPVDPRLARMILEGDRNGCVREVVVIAAALSIQDVRERPVDKQQAATEKHARFADPTSDFLALLNLWQYLREQQEALSSNAFRRMCRSEFLNYLRIREWQDLVSQLRQVGKQLGITYSTAPEDAERIHRSLLAGLLSHVGLKEPDKNEYLGARGARFAVFPGSALFRRPPRFVMAAELVETSRLWARIAAKIEPEWAEQLAGHLLKRSYSEPHWESKRGGVVAYEKVMLYGVPLVAARKVDYGRIDPQLSRELFIRHALVEGDWRTHHEFFHANREMLENVEELENRVRRRDIVVDDETLFAFYDERIPADVVSGQHFDAWWKKVRRSQPDLLDFSASMLVSDAEAASRAAEYPDTWRQGDLELPLSYQFEPGTAADGVTVHIPLPVLNRVESGGFDWQIPGLRLDVVTALIRSLPKQLRVNFVPAPDTARAALAELPGVDGRLTDALRDALYRLTRVDLPRDAWAWDRVPDHLRMTFRVESGDGTVRAEGKDLDELKRRLAPRVRTTIAEVAASIEQAGLTAWPGDVLPRTFEHRGAGGHAVRGYPALVDEGSTVAVRVLGTAAEQEAAHRLGVRRLLMLSAPNPLRSVLGGLSNQVKLALGRSPYRDVPALLDDAIAAAVDSLADDAPWDAAAFAALRDRVRADLVPAVTDVVTVTSQILASAHAAEARLSSVSQPALLAALTDIRAQLAGLVYPGFVSATGRRRLPDVLRYLQGIERRLDKLTENPGRDRDSTGRVEVVWEAYRELLDSLPPARRDAPDVRQIRWMIEELRVSLFAQGLKTAYPVSEQRIYRAMDQIAA
ncbi:MAG TPA: ATP-dependent RNA helicase HrpA [Mycobacteriales bacterium]|jgi:ATP-dependent helicase HrpA